MAADKPPVTITPLAARRYELLLEKEGLEAALAAVDSELITLGPGLYADAEDHAFRVVAATEPSQGPVSYALDVEKSDAARKLAGLAFRQLFDRHEVFSPCQGFADVAPKLLTPAKSRDLIALCLLPGKIIAARRAYVKAA